MSVPRSWKWNRCAAGAVKKRQPRARLGKRRQKRRPTRHPQPRPELGGTFMDTPRPIIIVKKKISHGGHHGGAWKVAYADFVTAMMALFIVLWLMNTSKP